MRHFRLLILAALAVAAASCSVTGKLPPADYSPVQLQFSGNSRLDTVMCPASIPGPAQRRVYAYLPSEYRDDGKPYPVVYLLHGARGSEVSWIVEGKLLSDIDSLWKASEMAEMIVVFPNMNSYDSEDDYAKSRIKGGPESFFEVDGAIESAFMNDVVRVIDSRYNTDTTKHARAIAGLSLGGLQALHISATNPDSFDYVGLFSAPVHSFVRKGPYSSFYDGLDDKMLRQFANPPKVYTICIGTKDIYRKAMEKFCKELDSRGWKYDFTMEPGGHQWPLWESFAISFLKTIFKVD